MQITSRRIASENRGFFPPLSVKLEAWASSPHNSRRVKRWPHRLSPSDAAKDAGLSIVDWRGARRGVCRGGGGLAARRFERQAERGPGHSSTRRPARRAPQDRIVQQTVFLADLGLVDRCRQIVRAFYGEHLPATTYVPQPPCNGSTAGHRSRSALSPAVSRRASLRRHSERLVIARHDGIEWLFCAFGRFVLAGDRRLRRGHGRAGPDSHPAAACRRRFRPGPSAPGFTLAGSWPTKAASSGTRNSTGPAMSFIAAFPSSQARQPRTAALYPASTGHRASSGRGLTAGAIAVRTGRDDVTATPLENPRQTAAYDYRAAYSPSAPRFSRAMALSCGRQAVIFISGTASITCSETRHRRDAVAQTEETLDNIEALISEDNLAGHGLPGFGARPCRPGLGSGLCEAAGRL